MEKFPDRVLSERCLLVTYQSLVVASNDHLLISTSGISWDKKLSNALYFLEVLCSECFLWVYMWPDRWSDYLIYHMTNILLLILLIILLFPQTLEKWPHFVRGHGLPYTDPGIELWLYISICFFTEHSVFLWELAFLLSFLFAPSFLPPFLPPFFSSIVIFLNTCYVLSPVLSSKDTVVTKTSRMPAF